MQAASQQRDGMERSVLVLGDVKWGARDAAEDGVLTGNEIAGLKLRGTQLVNATACFSAEGAVQVGEGLLGLRTAFLQAGSQAVMTSLWNISDVASCVFADLFYARLQRDKQEPSRALQETMRQFQRSQGLPTGRCIPPGAKYDGRSLQLSHPHNWAGYVLLGSDRFLALPSASRAD